MEKTQRNFDVIVIGGGSMGLSTAYHLSKRNIIRLGDTYFKALLPK